MDSDRQDKGTPGKVPAAVPPASGERAQFAWPWGLVAIGVMALAWVGIYLMWNGIVFLFAK
ncbi:hypothetical protein GCM10011321_09020 [Youhaiella tibetensis]|uniref:hypothetical protein n=1 Tax=Paradevosia tibetensis TaxID=1447062 RepID=UPI00067238FC|nr:hypothetical protein [Youhaiella tibetensis]AKR55880.1 hypothetical protein XM25_08715 [Devosia sp. H5989]GGF19696.1 hypothetical protein GCM10011321_09020 [Youhaiella tibetensis]